MSYLRAVMRRLDPWAALLLGVLLALGVVILLATPGPWQRVVGKEPPVRLEAPAPDDVAVFVLGGRAGSCTGIVWLHLDPTQNALSAVVVAPRVSGFVPWDGAAPLAEVVDAAGASTGAAALGRALGVSMDAWVTLDRRSLELVVQPMFPMNDVRAARTRYREARAAWRGRGGPERAWATQYETLRVALPRVAFSELGVVAFSNYVLGFGFVESDLTLEGATSLGEALQEVDPARVSVRAAPVIAERCRDGEVWRLDASRLEPLRQSLAIGLTPPETVDLVTRRTRPARVLVVAPLPRARAARYAAEVSARLDQSAGAPVEVTLVAGADDRLAFRAARELDARPALAALVAPAPASPKATAAVAKVCAMLRNRGQEAVAAGPLPARASAAAGSGARKTAGDRSRRDPAAGLVVAGGGAVGRRRRRAQLRPGGCGARQRADARARRLAGYAGAGPSLDAARIRVRVRPPYGRRRRERVRRAVGSGARAAAPLGIRRRTTHAGGQRLAARSARSSDLLPLGIANGGGGPGGGSWGAARKCRQVRRQSGRRGLRDRRVTPETPTAPYPRGWGAVGVTSNRSGPSGLTAAKQHAAADESCAGSEDQEHLSTGEGEFAALLTGCLQAHQVVLEDSLRGRSTERRSGCPADTPGRH